MKRRGQVGYEGGRSYRESLIPLILIVILAIFIAGKFGWIDLHSIPVIGGLFPAPYIKVVVIGRASPAMEALLKAEDYRIAGITYVGSLTQEVVFPGTLNNFDIIILQGQTVCDRTARKVIADRVKGGAKLIIVRDACTRVNDDPNAIGWDIGIGSLGDVTPVKYGGVLAHERTGRVSEFATGRFKIVSPDHPIFNGIVNYNFQDVVTVVYPQANAEVLAYVDQYYGRPTAPATYAIIESKGLLAGKTLYFAFDPATGSRNLFLNALLYMRGAKG